MGKPVQIPKIQTFISYLPKNQISENILYATLPYYNNAFS